ncbi:hypothetical protein QWY22_18760 [Planococcus liqunii]|nr:hypothetical protein [Planococcus sp. N056]WKA50907.1 hypothetical protein QWY22_18760 [Planococcus sp. N056]
MIKNLQTSHLPMQSQPLKLPDVLRTFLLQFAVHKRSKRSALC